MLMQKSGNPVTESGRQTECRKLKEKQTVADPFKGLDHVEADGQGLRNK